jgi:hypothetical protein
MPQHIAVLQVEWAIQWRAASRRALVAMAALTSLLCACCDAARQRAEKACATEAGTTGASLSATPVSQTSSVRYVEMFRVIAALMINGTYVRLSTYTRGSRDRPRWKVVSPSCRNADDCGLPGCRIQAYINRLTNLLISHQPGVAVILRLTRAHRKLRTGILKTTASSGATHSP